MRFSDFSPSSVAVKLLAAFATAVLLVLLAILFTKRGPQDGFLPTLFFSLFTTAWVAGPAALAAGFANLLKPVGLAWSFVGLQILTILSTAILMVPLFFYPDAQNGIVIAFVPIAQYLAIFAFLLLVVLTAAARKRLG